MINAGRHEVGRTRSLSFSRDLSWERPEERFRLGERNFQHRTRFLKKMTETVKRNTYSEHSQRAHGSGGPLSACKSRLPSSSKGDSTGAESEPEIRNARMTENNLDGHSQSSPLTVEVWATSINRQHREFLGSASVSAQEIQHPTGDIRLPLTGTVPLKPVVKERGGDSRDVVKAEVACATRPVPQGKDFDTQSWRGELFGSIGRVRLKDQQDELKGCKDVSEARESTRPNGSVYIWLGRDRASSTEGLEAGNGEVMLRVHNASGLKEVHRLRHDY